MVIDGRQREDVEALCRELRDAMANRCSDDEVIEVLFSSKELTKRAATYADMGGWKFEVKNEGEHYRLRILCGSACRCG